MSLGSTHSIYFDTNTLMSDAATAVQGMIEDNASASCHDRMNARTKQDMKAERYMIASTTFSDIPDCTRSVRVMSFILLHFFSQCIATHPAVMK